MRIRKILADQKLPFVREWDVEGNFPLTPSDVGLADKRKFLWRGSCGHSWLATLASRLEGNSCAVCNGKQINIGFNDLATINPELAVQWDAEKNQPLTPREVTKGSRKKVWWLCDKGHSFQSTVANRSYGYGCPFCSGRKFVKGVEDLESLYPAIAKQWSSKNSLQPSEVSGLSGKSFIWQCEFGHEWKTTVNSRTRQGTGCPTCWGRLRVEGENDVATLHPNLISRYDDLKNPKPLSFFGPSSAAIVWWKCPKGHSYRSTVNSQVIGSECNICTNRVFVPGVNDLKTLHPDFAAEFDEESNGCSASQVKAVSTKPFWWRCGEGHSFKVSANSRISRNTGCPYCANVKVLAGFNDLITKYPEVLKEWHPSRNEHLKPETIGASGKKAWWLGNCGHEWQASISSRTGQGVGCPYCAGAKVLPGFNDLATTHPFLAEEWAEIENSPLRPSDVTAGSGRKVWWTCKSGHTWKASLSHRSQEGSPRGCPSCARGGFSSNQEGYLYLLRNDSGSLQQFGISNYPEKRLKTHQKNGWTVLDIIGPADGLWVRETETSLKAYFRHLKVLLPRDYEDPFDGYSESWISEKVTYGSIQILLEDLRDWEWSQRE